MTKITDTQETNDIYMYQKIYTAINKGDTIANFSRESLKGKFTHISQPIELIATGVAASAVMSIAIGISMAFAAIVIPLVFVAALITACVPAVQEMFVDKTTSTEKQAKERNKVQLFAISVAASSLLSPITLALAAAAPILGATAACATRSYQTFFDKKPTSSEGETQQSAANLSYKRSS